jgi:hypothetical protein
MKYRKQGSSAKATIPMFILGLIIAGRPSLL